MKKMKEEKVYVFHCKAWSLQFLVSLLSSSKGTTKWREIKGDNCHVMLSHSKNAQRQIGSGLHPDQM